MFDYTGRVCPMHVMIYNICNQMCVHCANPYIVTTDRTKESTEQDIIDQIDSATDFVLFTGGGEPTMVMNLPEHIEYAKAKGLRVGVETNGMLLAYPEYAQKLKDAGLDYYIVSLHSHKAQVCDRITQVPKSFDLIIKGMKNMEGLGIPLTTMLHTLSEHNYRDLVGFMEYCRTLGVKELGVSFIRPRMDHATSQKITPRLTDAKPYIHKGFKRAAELGIKVTMDGGLGVPLCFLQGLEHTSDELRIYEELGPEEHRKQCYAHEKVKAPQCKECIYDRSCAGVQESYAQAHGTDELRPVKHICGRIQLTRDCNQECVFCSVPPTDKDRSLAVIKKEIDKLKSEGANELMLTGGEPMKSQHLLEVIRYAKDFKEISIQTNGTLLDEDLIKDIIKIQPHIKIIVSVHSSKAKIHKKISGFDNHGKLMRALELIGKYNLSSYVAITICSLNYKELKDHIQNITQRFAYIKHLSINYVDPTNRAIENSWCVPTYKETEKYISKAAKFMIGKGISFRLERVPLCYMKGFEEYSTDIRRDVFDEKRMTSFIKTDKEPDFKIEKQSNYYYAAQCKKCSLNKLCPGINPNYVAVHGDKEVVPVKTTQESIIKRISR